MFPVGTASDFWTPGPNFGLTASLIEQGDLVYSLQLSFSRQTPDHKTMLLTDGVTMTTDRSKGDLTIYGLTALACYSPEMVNSENIGLTFIGGLGLYSVERSEVYVKGFATLPPGSQWGNAAINREIRRPAESSITAGISAGLELNIVDHIRPNFGYRHIFVEDEGGAVWAGVAIRVW